jgi:hypothetical protein
LKKQNSLKFSGVDDLVAYVRRSVLVIEEPVSSKDKHNKHKHDTDADADADVDTDDGNGGGGGGGGGRDGGEPSEEEAAGIAATAAAATAAEAATYFAEKAAAAADDAAASDDDVADAAKKADRAAAGADSAAKALAQAKEEAAAAAKIAQTSSKAEAKAAAKTAAAAAAAAAGGGDANQKANQKANGNEKSTRTVFKFVVDALKPMPLAVMESSGDVVMVRDDWTNRVAVNERIDEVTGKVVPVAVREKATPGFSLAHDVQVFLNSCRRCECTCSCDVHLCSLALCARKSHDQYAINTPQYAPSYTPSIIIISRSICN